jgi:hypothetical protein
MQMLCFFVRLPLLLRPVLLLLLLLLLLKHKMLGMLLLSRHRSMLCAHTLHLHLRIALLLNQWRLIHDSLNRHQLQLESAKCCECINTIGCCPITIGCCCCCGCAAWARNCPWWP